MDPETAPGVIRVTAHPPHLADRYPTVSPEQLLASLVPPPQFAEVSLSTFRPDPAHPSQATALDAVSQFVEQASSPQRGRRRISLRAAPRPSSVGLYLDGGFGVGKTHLLASAWHAVPQAKAYMSFTQLTQLVGAVGFRTVADRLAASALVCIDEFELDDPGDTVLVSTLLNRVREAGARIAVTSNTLPGALGEGRFDTTDFVREIQTLAAHFTSVRIDGPDFRHREGGAPARATDPATVGTTARETPGATDDDFTQLVRHLRDIHPSRYAALVDGVRVVCLREVRTLHDQSDALRLVALVDRLYEKQIPVVASGVRLDLVFDDEMLNGGYRKKYQRAISRLSALTSHADTTEIP